jgi:hypothetical protein
LIYLGEPCLSLILLRGTTRERVDVDIMVFVGGIKPPRVTLTEIEYSGKQEETLKH